MSVSRSMVSLTYLLVMVVITSALTISALPVVARGAQTESIPVAVKLHQDGDRGVLGWVFLSSPRDDGQTHVWAILSRAEPHPIHIYRGSCDDQQASPAYQLNGVDAVGESETAIDIRLADLLKEDHVIKVHQSIEQMGTLLSCELIEPGNPSDEDMLDGPGVTANKDAVTYRPPAGEEARLPLEERRAVQTGDAINVLERGEGWLSFADYLLVRIFRGSNLAISIEGDVDPQAPPLITVELTAGTVMGSRSELQALTTQRVTVTTLGAVITATGTKFLAHYDPQTELTWVVVARGQVDVSAAGETITVEPGWQSWVRRGQPPEASVPATRAAAEARFPGVFPSLEAMTIEALRDDALLGNKPCVVDTADGLRLRVGTGTSFSVLETMARDSVFEAMNWSADLAWVYGESETGRVGWASAEYLTCSYPPAPLVLTSPVTATASTAVPSAPLTTVDRRPTAPSDLTATAPPTFGESATVVYLSWSPASDDEGIVAYHIARDGNIVATVDGETTNYDDVGVEPDVTYTYEVLAEDTARQLSDPSNAVAVTTSPGEDAPPAPPTNLSATREGLYQVNLFWSAASDDQGISGYTIYRNGTYLGDVDGATTAYRDDGVDCNEGASYVVYAMDTSGQGSGPSNQADVPPNNCGIN